MLKIVYEELQQIINVDSRQVGIEAIYLDRADLERRLPIDAFLTSAKKDVLIVAIGATRIATQYQQLLRTLIDRGVKVRILLQATSITCDGISIDNPILDQLACDSGKNANAFRTEIDTPVKYLEDLKSLLQASKKNALTVLRYSWIPSCSVIIVDGDSTTGTALVEIHPYGCEASGRPSFRVCSCNSDKSLYNTFVRQYNLLWQKAKKQI